jgi:GT2 family glycosyltransferase
MAAEPLISLCIANYDGIDLIDACIASIRQQVNAPAYEIIVHDDASTDGSVGYIQEKYPDVHLIASRENVGFCVANNRMASLAQGAYLLLLNNDATLLPDALATLLGEAERLASPAILTLPQFDANTGELLDIGCRLDPFLNPVPQRVATSGDVGTVHGACLWIDKVLWDEIGGFPEWFGSVGEDLYLCCRTRLAGYPVRALGRSGYLHQVGASFGGGKVSVGRLVTTFRRRALSERNKTFVMVMTYPAFWVLLLPFHLLLLLIEGTLLTLLKTEPDYLRRIYIPVFAALLREMRHWRAARIAIMRNRRLASADFFRPFDLVPWKLRMLLRHGVPEAK